MKLKWCVSRIALEHWYIFMPTNAKKNRLPEVAFLHCQDPRKVYYVIDALWKVYNAIRGLGLFKQGERQDNTIRAREPIEYRELIENAYSYGSSRYPFFCASSYIDTDKSWERGFLQVEAEGDVRLVPHCSSKQTIANWF